MTKILLDDLKWQCPLWQTFSVKNNRFKRHSRKEKTKTQILNRRLLWLIYSDPRKKKKNLLLLKPETYFISSLTLPPQSIIFVHMLIVHKEWCPTLCNPMDCCPPGSSVHGILQVRRRVGCHAFLQGIFLTQGLNPGLLQFGQILYCLSHQESPGLSLSPT